MSEDDRGDMTGRRLRGPRSASASPVHPLENKDLLAQILLLLPALPSSLVRASAVCKHWHAVVSDPHFLRTFRAHHRSPPVLGFFPRSPPVVGFFPRDFEGRIEFTSVLDPPDQIPASRFSLRVTRDCRFLRSHHGHVLIANQRERHFLVWDPVTGVVRQVAFPRIAEPFGHVMLMDGGVACASTDQDHVHGACHSDPFLVVFIAQDTQNDTIYGCVYSSETGAWGNLFSIIREPKIMMPSPTCRSTLFMNSLCLLLIGQKAAILEFDWSRQNLALIDVPSDAPRWRSFLSGECQFLITPTDSGGLSFIVLKAFSVRVWKRTSNGVGDATWILGNTIELNNLLSLEPAVNQVPIWILGLDQDGNVMFKLADSEIVVVNLESKMFKKLPQKLPYIYCQPFSSFYTPPGMFVITGHNDEVQTSRGA